MVARYLGARDREVVAGTAADEERGRVNRHHVRRARTVGVLESRRFHSLCLLSVRSASELFLEDTEVDQQPREVVDPSLVDDLVAFERHHGDPTYRELFASGG